MHPSRVVTFACITAGLLALASEAASASPALVLANLNLRQGPGTNFGIITTIPGGSTVEVGACTGDWCTISFGGRGGYVPARNLDMGGPAPVAVTPGADSVEPPLVVESPVIVGAPAYYYAGPRYWGPRYY